MFMKIAAKVQTLPSAIKIVACFETLYGARPTILLLGKLPGICSEDEAHYVDVNCDRSKVKHWAQWWCRSTHLQMLCKALTKMDNQTWEECPTTTNAVEHKKTGLLSEQTVTPKISYDGGI